MKLFLARTKHLLVTFLVFVVSFARKLTSALLTVPNSPRGVLIRDDLIRATHLAFGSGVSTASISTALLFLSTEQPFLQALAPLIQLRLMEVGIVPIPLPIIIGIITFTGTHLAALTALRQRGAAAVSVASAAQMISVEGSKEELTKAHPMIAEALPGAAIHACSFADGSASLAVEPAGLPTLGDSSEALEEIARKLRPLLRGLFVQVVHVFQPVPK